MKRFIFTIIILLNLGFSTTFCAYLHIISSIKLKYDNTSSLKFSKVSDKIHIIGNSGWIDFKNAGNCSGEGTYSDPYIIKNLVINGGESGSCICIENSNVYFKIESCRVYNSESSWGNAGIKLYNTNNSQLIKNICSSNCIGIFLNMYCSNNIISGNTIRFNNLYGIEIVNFCMNNTIIENFINEGNDIAIEIEFSNNNSILGNSVCNNENGIWVLECNNITVLGNTIDNNNYNGIYLHYSNNIIIRRNIISNNNYRGINLDHTQESLIYFNCLNNNFLRAYDDYLNNHWDNGSMGNFWDDYTGLDEDGNGIGDTPYNIASPVGNQDHFPLMKCPISTQEGDQIDLGLIIFISAIISGGIIVVIFSIWLIIPKRKKSS